MVKVYFEAENIKDLKLQIQEYSLAHLGLNFAEIANQTMNGPMFRKKPGPKPGKNKRIHSPSFPAPTNLDQPSEPVTIPSASEPAVDVGAGLTPDEEANALNDVKDAIKDLHKVKGLPAVVDALEKFGTSHMLNLKPEQYRDFIKYCIEVMNG